MRKDVRGLAVGLAVTAALVGATAAGAAPAPGDCPNDTKGIGPVSISTADEPGTWWYLTRTGFDAAGVTDYKAKIESLFGIEFGTLEEAIEAVVAGVRPLDKNGNGYVCASTLRGTRAFIGDPDFAYYFFGVIDDKHV